MRRFIAIVIVLLATVSPAAAQDEPVRPLVLQLPASTRAFALGNAYTLASVDPDALFYHPALIDAARGFSGSVARYGDSSALFALSGAIDWWRGAVAVGVQSFSRGALTPESNDEDEPFPGEPTASSAEQVITAAYARSLFGFRLGIAGKLIDQRTAGERDLTAAGDISAARNIGFVTVAVTGRNIGRDPAFDTFDTVLPTTVTLAGATRSSPFGPLDLSAAAATSWMRGDRFAAGAGIEAAYWPVPGRTFIARVGYRWVEDADLFPVTVGAGFVGDRISIDWAFQSADDGDDAHRVTLRWR